MVDASDMGSGVVLLQEEADNGIDHPV